jgi:hypothetical protein
MLFARRAVSTGRATHQQDSGSPCRAWLDSTGISRVAGRGAPSRPRLVVEAMPATGPDAPFACSAIDSPPSGRFGISMSALGPRLPTSRSAMGPPPAIWGTPVVAPTLSRRQPVTHLGYRYSRKIARTFDFGRRPLREGTRVHFDEAAIDSDGGSRVFRGMAAVRGRPPADIGSHPCHGQVTYPSTMRCSPIGPFWWAHRLLSAPIGSPSRKTAIRSPFAAATMRPCQELSRADQLGSSRRTTLRPDRGLGRTSRSDVEQPRCQARSSRDPIGVPEK